MFPYRFFAITPAVAQKAATVQILGASGMGAGVRGQPSRSSGRTQRRSMHTAMDDFRARQLRSGTRPLAPDEAERLHRDTSDPGVVWSGSQSRQIRRACSLPKAQAGGFEYLGCRHDRRSLPNQYDSSPIPMNTVTKMKTSAVLPVKRQWWMTQWSTSAATMPTTTTGTPTRRRSLIGEETTPTPQSS